MCKSVVKYLSSHPYYNATIHTIIGMGLGALFVMSVFNGHTLRWGVGLIALGLLGHLYPLTLKKK
ncbi:MAG: hypothetical protein Q7S44_01090 [bacterium]|nr:hypothetical protein [bacterium]